MNFLLISLFIASQVPQGVEENSSQTTTLSELDAAILKKRMEDIYGEYGRAKSSTWTVDFGGKSEDWVWNGSEFACESKAEAEEVSAELEPLPDEFPDCSNWVPLSFKWWQSKNAWLEPWVSFEKLGYELTAETKKSKPRRSVEIVQSIIVAEQEAAEQSPQDEEPILLGGKRPALEAWLWRDIQDRELKVYTSLRNNWVERIDHGDTTEYIEWTQANRWTKPEIRKVFVERGGVRLGMTRKK